MAPSEVTAMMSVHMEKMVPLKITALLVPLTAVATDEMPDALEMHVEAMLP